MGLTPRLEDFDHTTHDSRGIVGVKDGVEYSISEEEWKKAHPEHRNTECKECTFASNIEELLVFNVPKEMRDKANHRPEFIGKFTMPGWTGHSGFYLFKCEVCQEICVDYPHGYRGNGCLYLRCGQCGYEIVLTPRKYGDVYKRDNVVPPPTFWKMIKTLWALRKVKNLKWFEGSEDERRALQKPLNTEDQQKLKTSGRVPTELES